MRTIHTLRIQSYLASLLKISRFQIKRTYAVAYAARVRLPTPRIPRSVAAVSSKPPYLRGEPAAFGTATGLVFQSTFGSFLSFRLQVENL